MPVPESRPAYASMRRAVDALVTGSEPIRVRLQAAEESFRELDPAAVLDTELEQNLWHRIASSLVSGGVEKTDDEEDDYSPAAVAVSIGALDDETAVLIARDMLRLYELTASPPDDSLSWPSQRWSDEPEKPAET